MKIAVIGAGAAGCFCAIQLKRLLPSAEVDVYESGKKALAKVAVTGGGRCNLTNSFEFVESLSRAYPRGDKLLKRILRVFGSGDLCRWFRSEGVELVTQDDGCVFPASQDAMQIVDTLLSLMQTEGVRLHCGRRVESIEPSYSVKFSDGGTVSADCVVVTVGGASLSSLERLLGKFDLEISTPVPSLFTFKIEDCGLMSLMGTVVKNVSLSLAGTSFRSEGTLLVSDWGVSGPATLKLSSYAARYLNGNAYRANLIVNWMNAGESEARECIEDLVRKNPAKKLSGAHPAFLTERLWKFLLSRSSIREDIRCCELGGKGFSKLISTLTADTYAITGRAAFKEEFVTCGGVALSNISYETMESRKYRGLYFAGEVLDIDGITGGFNLQAAWSGAYVVAGAIASSSHRNL